MSTRGEGGVYVADGALLTQKWAGSCVLVMEGSGWGRGHKGNVDEDV